jgi:hypothetical protein
LTILFFIFVVLKICDYIKKSQNWILISELWKLKNDRRINHEFSSITAWNSRWDW